MSYLNHLSAITMNTIHADSVRNSLILVEESTGRIVDVLNQQQQTTESFPSPPSPSPSPSYQSRPSNSTAPPSYLSTSPFVSNPNTSNRNRPRSPSLTGSIITLHTLRLAPNQILTFGRNNRDFQKVDPNCGDDREAEGESSSLAMKGETRRTGTYMTDVSRASFFTAPEGDEESDADGVLDTRVVGDAGARFPDARGGASVSELSPLPSSRPSASFPSNPPRIHKFTTQTLDHFWETFFLAFSSSSSGTDGVVGLDQGGVNTGNNNGGLASRNGMDGWVGMGQDVLEWMHNSYNSTLNILPSPSSLLTTLPTLPNFRNLEINQINPFNTTSNLVASLDASPSTHFTSSSSSTLGTSSIDESHASQATTEASSTTDGNPSDVDAGEEEVKGLGVWYLDAEGTARRVWAAGTGRNRNTTGFGFGNGHGDLRDFML